MVVTDSELRQLDDTVGAGVFATRRLPVGTIVWVQDPMDRVFSKAEYDQLREPLKSAVERYSYGDHEGNLILCWDLAKYFNHSCEASCLGLDFPFEVVVRDIEVGEQLTDDYGTFRLEEEQPFRCRCGSPTCRGTIGPADRERMMPIWQDQIRAALARVHEVPQPLAALLPEGVLEAVLRRYGLAG